jgi:hypothetical protein
VYVRLTDDDRSIHILVGVRDMEVRLLQLLPVEGDSGKTYNLCSYFVLLWVLKHNAMSSIKIK